MAGRAVHFSLSYDEVAVFRDLDREGRITHLFNTVEPDLFHHHPERLAESDKAWDAMHRALTNGRLEWAGGAYPLNHFILGGEVLEEDDVVMVLKTPDQVRDVASALPSVTREGLRVRYDSIRSQGYEGSHGDVDFEYTWDWFEYVRTFWLHAAAERRYVLFTVSV